MSYDNPPLSNYEYFTGKKRDTDWRSQGLAQEPGCTGGFHYGNGCNGVYQATDRVTEDGKQIYVCDACGQKGVRK